MRKNIMFSDRDNTNKACPRIRLPMPTALLAAILAVPTSVQATMIGDTIRGNLKGAPDFTSNTAVVTGGLSPTASGGEFNTNLFGPPLFQLVAEFSGSEGLDLSIAWGRLQGFPGEFGPVTWTFRGLELLGDPGAIIAGIEDLGGDFEVQSFGIVSNNAIQIRTAAIKYDNLSGGEPHYFRLAFRSEPIPEPGAIASVSVGLLALILVQAGWGRIRSNKEPIRTLRRPKLT